jgi:hypothetical protein
MNAGKNLCFADSLLHCLRITDIHKILEHHNNCIGLLLYELFIVEDLMVTEMKNSNQSTVPVLG